MPTATQRLHVKSVLKVATVLPRLSSAKVAPLDSTTTATRAPRVYSALRVPILLVGCLHAPTVSRDKRILIWMRQQRARHARPVLRALQRPPRVSSAARESLITTRTPLVCARRAHVASTIPRRVALIVATTVLPERICPLVAAARSTIARPAHRGSLPPLAPLLVNPVPLARQMQIRTRQRSAAHVATARMPAVAVSHANRASRGAVMATVTRRPRARCATQGSSGSTRAR